MAIVLVAPAVVTPIAASAVGGAAAGGGIGAFAAKLLATTAISTALSFAASALQPKASATGGETAGRMVSVSNTGTDPRNVILGKFRDAGTLIWHKEHEGHKVKVTQVIQLCDLPIEQYVSEVVDGSIEPLVPNESQTVKGHESGGTGFNFGDTPTPDSADWMPVVGDGGHGDIWRKTDAPTRLYTLRGKKWVQFPGATFHDLASADPTAGLGANGDIAINRTSGEVFIKRGGFWRSRARTPGTAGANDRTFFEASGEPGEHSRFLHWEDGDRRWRWHFKVRYYTGTQTTADSFLTAIADSASEWGSAFVGNRLAYKVVTQRYYPNIYTGAFPVQTSSIMLGIKVYDPRLPATGADTTWYGTAVKADQIAWTANAALLAAFIKVWPGLPGNVPYAEIDEAELIASADVCDEVVTNPDTTTEPRYTINGMVQSTESRDSVEEALEIAMGGHIFRRGGKWVIWAGRARSSVKSFDRRNIVSEDYEYQPGAGIRDRKNTVTGTYFNPNQQYNQVSMKKVQPAAMLSADNGQILSESIHFRFSGHSRFTPRRIAKIWLHNRRAESNALTVRLDVEALDLSPVDVIEMTESFVGFEDTRFVVSELNSPYLSVGGAVSTNEEPYVQCALYAYDPNTWDAPGEDPTEEDFELPSVRDLSEVDPPASIAVAAVNPRAPLDIDGRLLANVVITAGRSLDLRVVEYELQYRMSPENFISPFSSIWGTGSLYQDQADWATVSKAPNAEREIIRFPLKALYDGAMYDFRVCAINIAGARSDEFTADEWTRQIDAHLVSTGRVPLPGPPGTGITGGNKILDGNFELGPNAGTWLLSGAGSTATGSAAIATTAGKYGPHELRIDISAAAIGNEFLARHNIYHPVSAGEWHRYLVGARRRTGPTFEARLNMLFYDTALALIATKVPVQETVFSSAYAESRFVGRSQVPGDNQVVWARPQIQHEALSSGAQDSGWDGVAMHDLSVMRGERQTTQVNRTNDTWTNLATLQGFADSATTEASIYFDGETTITVRGSVYASVARGATNITVLTRAVARLRLEEVGVGTTTIVTQVPVARMTVGDGLELGAGSTDEDIRHLETTLMPAAGHYKIHLEGRHLGDTTNGTAQFHDRWIRIVKD